jgi:acyl carrier protein
MSKFLPSDKKMGMDDHNFKMLINYIEDNLDIKFSEEELEKIHSMNDLRRIVYLKTHAITLY